RAERRDVELLADHRGVLEDCAHAFRQAGDLRARGGHDRLRQRQIPHADPLPALRVSVGRDRADRDEMAQRLDQKVRIAAGEAIERLDVVARYFVAATDAEDPADDLATIALD